MHISVEITEATANGIFVLAKIETFVLFFLFFSFFNMLEIVLCSNINAFSSK